MIILNTGCPYNTTSAGIIKGREDNEGVEEVFQWLVTEFSKYDSEVYVPAKLFKEAEIKIENYPEDVKDADMKGIEDSELKANLSKKWEKVNG